MKPCASISASVQPSGQRASNRSARMRSVVAAGKYQAPDVVALRLRMRPMLGADHEPAAFLLDGCNCWRVCHGVKLGGFRVDLLDDRNDSAPNLGLFDSCVCPY